MRPDYPLGATGALSASRLCCLILGGQMKNPYAPTTSAVNAAKRSIAGNRLIDYLIEAYRVVSGWVD